jgi:NAD(P)-dependent dehydrogenase (short-subunit alcohol dehydrogenase family)
MPQSAIIIGSSGGIGGAVTALLGEACEYAPVLGLSRRSGDFDYLDEASIAAAAKNCANHPAPGLIFIGTGLLHDVSKRPERSYRELDVAWMAQNFAINTIGPALIAKHFLPLLAKDQHCVIAFLSARVGSIGDNKLGGWHSYRASKAALNMLIRNIAVELGRSHKLAICVGLHPGTVATPLSAPFQAGVAKGKLFDTRVSAAHLLSVISTLTPEDSGKCFAWDGSEIQP